MNAGSEEGDSGTNRAVSNPSSIFTVYEREVLVGCCRYS